MMDNTNLSLIDYKIQNQPEYTVTEVSSLIKKTVEQNLNFVRVKGEISGLKIAPSGHVYFSLKEGSAVLASVCWKNSAASLKSRPEEGMEVVCIGSITTYAGQSKYQMIVKSINPAGVGALMALLEKRKQQFEKEGLFDHRRKRKLPYLPQTIGVVTSPTGAVIQDILHRISDRFPVNILLWPVLVQGENSAQQIAKAIYGLNNIAANKSAIPKPDLIIVARGGGSIEDLWSFNEEVVVRAVSNSKIPIISAVGHETDTTLIDYVSDVRAPTPTAAAEMAVPVRVDLIATLDDLNKRTEYAFERYLSNGKNLLESLGNALPNLRYTIDNYTQRLDELSIRMVDFFPRYNQYMVNKLETISSRVQSPSHYLQLCKDRLTVSSEALNNIARQALSDKGHNIELNAKLLNSYDYKNTLKRGFTITRDKATSKILKSASDVKGQVTIEFHDGIKFANS